LLQIKDKSKVMQEQDAKIKRQAVELKEQKTKTETAVNDLAAAAEASELAMSTLEAQINGLKASNSELTHKVFDLSVNIDDATNQVISNDSNFQQQEREHQRQKQGLNNSMEEWRAKHDEVSRRLRSLRQKSSDNASNTAGHLAEKDKKIEELGLSVSNMAGRLTARDARINDLSLSVTRITNASDQLQRLAIQNISLCLADTHKEAAPSTAFNDIANIMMSKTPPLRVSDSTICPCAIHIRATTAPMDSVKFGVNEVDTWSLAASVYVAIAKIQFRGVVIFSQMSELSKRIRDCNDLLVPRLMVKCLANLAHRVSGNTVEATVELGMATLFLSRIMKQIYRKYTSVWTGFDKDFSEKSIRSYIGRCGKLILALYDIFQEKDDWVSLVDPRRFMVPVAHWSGRTLIADDICSWFLFIENREGVTCIDLVSKSLCLVNDDMTKYTLVLLGPAGSPSREFVLYTPGEIQWCRRCFLPTLDSQTTNLLKKIQSGEDLFRVE
jgi:hypothetical protein